MSWLSWFLLVTCRWYHGSLSRSEAEGLLTLCKESSYLVRNSQTGRNDYSLSLRLALVLWPVSVTYAYLLHILLSVWEWMAVTSVLFPARSCKGFMHMKFSQSADGRYVLGENSPPFSTIPEVIHYYTTHKLPIRGAEHMSLLYPVIVQTLWHPCASTILLLVLLNTVYTPYSPLRVRHVWCHLVFTTGGWLVNMPASRFFFPKDQQRWMLISSWMLLGKKKLAVETLGLRFLFPELLG